MLRIREAIVVEGRYDKNALAQVVDALIIETSGFGLFRDRELIDLLRRVAARQGLIVLTDPDGAGFLIRGKIKSALPPERVKHAYIPDVAGKERRKTRPGKEGKLGVEGMSPDVLRDALLRAGATVLDGEAPPVRGLALTKADLMAAGLSGGSDSAARRRALARALGLPERLGANALLQVLNACVTREELDAALAEL